MATDFNTFKDGGVGFGLGSASTATRTAWIDPDGKYRTRYQEEKAVEKEEAVVAETGVNICKVTDERTSSILSFFEDYYDYDSLCVDATPKEEGENISEWFFRQENRLQSVFAARAVAAERAREAAARDDRLPPMTCFPGSAYLLKEDGSTMTFGELAELSSSGLEIPAIASWSESGQVVYQKPTAVIDRGIVNSELLFIGASDGVGSVAPLQVTGNHPLLVERGGAKEWVPAGKLADGDVLVSVGGEKYNFDRSTTLVVMGGVHLYDVSFTTPEGSFSPTFLVSSDGKTWYVAHNKMM